MQVILVNILFLYIGNPWYNMSVYVSDVIISIMRRSAKDDALTYHPCVVKFRKGFEE